MSGITACIPGAHTDSRISQRRGIRILLKLVDLLSCVGLPGDTCIEQINALSFGQSERKHPGITSHGNNGKLDQFLSDWLSESVLAPEQSPVPLQIHFLPGSICRRDRLQLDRNTSHHKFEAKARSCCCKRQCKKRDGHLMTFVHLSLNRCVCVFFLQIYHYSPLNLGIGSK